jgi:hypothetical protein
MSHIGPNFRSPGQPQQKPAASQPLGDSKVFGSKSDQSGVAPEPGLPGGLLPAAMSLGALFTHENLLSAQQMMQLLRNLLQMPREIVQLLALFANLDPKMGAELLKQLLKEDLQVPLEELQELMQTHIDKAQDKLLKLMQNNAMSMTSSGQQLNDLMNTLSDMAAKTGKSPIDALHGTISLYLPYYPLHPPQAFSLRFEAPEQQNEEEDAENKNSGADSQLVLLIQTLTLGQFKITLITERLSQLQAIIEHDALATPIMGELEAQVKEALGEGNTQAIHLISIPRSGGIPASAAADEPRSMKTTAPNTKQGQAVGIHPVGGISALAIHGAYLLIRIILEIDTRIGLLEKRAAAL